MLLQHGGVEEDALADSAAVVMRVLVCYECGACVT